MSLQTNDIENAEIQRTVSQSELIEPLGTPEQIGWHNAGITMLETFTMKETGWFFCVVAGNSKDNTVKLNCEATGKGTISWTGTLEELFSEFERT